MEKLAQPLHFYLEKHGFQEQLKKRIYLRIWPDVAGKKIIRYTKPVKIDGDKLIVEVNDSTWLYHLTLLKARIIEDFNTKAKASIIRDIKFINADFRSQRQENRESPPRGKSDYFVAAVHQNKGIQLKKEEIEIIEKAVSAVPDYLRASLRRLYKNHYLQQNYGKKQGAKQCQRCAGFFFRLEGQLCYYCQQDLDAWAAVLDNFFKQTPWKTCDVLQREHPFLDEQLFNIYKDRLLLNYARNLISTLAREELGEEERKEKLKEAVQPYILLITGKEPAAIQKKHIFTALKSFPGLYQLLYA